MEKAIVRVQRCNRVKRVKKLLLTILSISFAILLTACHSDTASEETPAPQSLDLTGQWRQVNNEAAECYQGAIISGDQIEIYWVSNNGSSRSLYWAGSFSAPDTADEPYLWVSQNDKEKTGGALLASPEDTKEFTYESGQISYSATTLGTTQTIRLEKEEWAPGLTIGAGTQSDETVMVESIRPADVTYTPFSIADIEFSIPSYYEETGTETVGNTVWYNYEFRKNGAKLAGLTFGAENTGIPNERADEFQNEFDKAKDTITDNLIKAMGTAKLVDSNDTTLAGLSARRFTNVMINDINAKINGICTFAYNSTANKIVYVMLAYGPDYDFIINDYDQIIQTAKLLTPIEPDNVATESDDTSVPVTGLRPEFKEAMDTYEAFYRDYCDLLKKYGQNPSDLTLLQEYMNMLTKAQEMNEAFDEWNQDEMNNEELKYYLDVHSRILQMLAEVNG